MVFESGESRRGFVLILLDTHTLVWYRSADVRLGEGARHALDIALLAREAFVSAISFWEMGMLIQKGRYVLSEELADWRMDLLNRGLIEIEVDGVIGLTAGLLPHQHGDPADRLIVATAICSGAMLLTADRSILEWDGPFDRQDARS